MKRYTNQVRAVNPPVKVVFLGNKVDLMEERAITVETLTAVTTELNAPILLTSAKTGANVEAAFALLADLLEGEDA